MNVLFLNCLLLCCIVARFVLLRAYFTGRTALQWKNARLCDLQSCIPQAVHSGVGLISTGCWWLSFWCLGCLLQNLGHMIHDGWVLHTGSFHFPVLSPTEACNSCLHTVVKIVWYCIGIYAYQLVFRHDSFRTCRYRVSRYGTSRSQVCRFRVRRIRRVHSCTDRCHFWAYPNTGRFMEKSGYGEFSCHKPRKSLRRFYHNELERIVYPSTLSQLRGCFVNLGFGRLMIIYPAMVFTIAWHTVCATGHIRHGYKRSWCYDSCRAIWRKVVWGPVRTFRMWFHCVRPPNIDFWNNFNLHGSPVNSICGASVCFIQMVTHYVPLGKKHAGVTLGTLLGRVWGWRGVRVGEAKNPGPGHTHRLELSTFNPTQLLGKEPEICALGQGVFGVSETSTTELALKSIKHKFQKSGFHTAWSKCVDPQRPKNSLLRGKASGTAIISSYPLRPFWEPPSMPTVDSHRFCDAIIQLNANTCIYFATMYGFVNNRCHVDPLGSTNRLFNEIAERALNFQGPAAIVGDFNWDLHDLKAWKTLCKAGWVDAAVLDGLIHQRTPQLTYKDSSRRMFILVNGHLARSLVSCRTCDDFLFGGHPLLNGVFNTEILVAPVLKWVLPATTDDLLFDADLAEDQARIIVNQQKSVLQNAIAEGKHNEAAKISAQMVEHTWNNSVVDVEGNLTRIKPKHLGRDRISPLQYRHTSIPVVRKARDGDFDPQQGQLNVSLRRRTRQLRRLQSLSHQLHSLDKTQTSNSRFKCEQLWQAILNSPGFTKGFATWIGNSLGWFVPVSLPHRAYVVSLTEAFEKVHQEELHWYFLTKRRSRKLSVALDCDKGGPNAFRDIRDDPPAPLSYVVESVDFVVKKVRWPKQGRCNIWVHDGDRVQCGIPIYFQGQSALVTRVQEGSVFVDKPLRLRSNHFVATQRVATANPACMRRKVLDTWNIHWKRDDHLGEDGFGEDLDRYLSYIPQSPTIDKKPFCWEKWKAHCKGLNTKAARGGCGFSVKEMVRFPRPLVEQLFMIFDSCEDGNRWPDNWILARVTMLSKSDSPVSAFDARPITVFSVLYRQWSRYRSREILEYYATFMPSTIALATNRVPADISAAMTALKIECAINTRSTLCGLGIDLVRCFNTLPRAPIRDAMKRMGVPPAYINAWVIMLQHMARTLLVGMSQGEPSQSSTGAPEGCGMSVVAMATVSWWVIKILDHCHQSIDPSCYADNWQILSHEPEALIEATHTLKDFVDHMKMAIAPNKSYLWATTRAARRRLEGIFVDNIAIPVVTNYSDLGCDIHCCGKVVKPKYKKRLNKTKRIFKRIPNSTVAKNFKMRLIKGAGLASLNYGSAIQWTPQSTWKSIRADVAKSLALMYPAASAWLAVAVTTGDPQCYHLYTVCTFWRRFIHTFPHLGDKFLDMVQHPGICKNGPAANFRRTLLDSGWKMLNDPKTISHFGGLQLHWIGCSKKWLNFGLTRMWNCSVHNSTYHRKDCGVGIPDCNLANDVLKTLIPRDQWAMRVLMSGKQFTHDILSKFAPDISKQCPLCGKMDNKKHRIFECKALEPIRCKHKDALHFARKQPKIFRLLGFPVVQATSWIKLSHSNPVARLQHRFEDDNEFRHFFLDGSAYHQDCREFTISGWAVIESEPGSHKFTMVDSGVVPGGEHSSYRGESLALLRALERTPRGCFYSDCQSVVDNFRTLQKAVLDNLPYPSIDHSDIWGLVWEVLVDQGPQNFEIIKVKAHQDVAPISDPHERWLILGNDEADKCAKAAVRSHPLFKTIADDYKSQKQYKQSFLKYVKCLCDLANETFRILSTKKSEHSKVVSQPAPPDFNLWLIPTTDIHYQLPPWDCLVCTCPFGRIFYERVSTWFQKLHWPRIRGSSRLGISLLELYVDFVVDTQSEAPINDCKKGSKAKYCLLDCDPLLKEAGAPLHKHTKTWITFWKWALTNNLVEAPLVWDINKPVTHVGYSLRGCGFTIRPRLTNNEVALAWLWTYFHPSSGRRRNLSAPLRPWYRHTGNM